MSNKPVSQSGAIHDHLFQVKHGEKISSGYEIVSAINNGCMGTVYKVKRSAAYEKKLQQKEGRGMMRRLFDRRYRSRSRSRSKSPNNSRSTFQKVKGAKRGSSDLRRASEVFYALKTIKLDRIDSPMHIQALENEITTLCSLDHPNIITAYEVYVTNTKMEIVLDYCYGGDLYSRYPYSEKDASKLSKQILSAVMCMHNQGLIHRELMFENILFENENPNASIKVIDFGFAEKYSAKLNNIENYGVNSIYAMAPQTLQGITTKQSDMWSIGVILYMLLVGKKPFHSTVKQEMIDKIKRADYSFKEATPSDTAKDIITSLIVVDPKTRLDSATAMKHAFFQNQDTLSEKISQIAFKEEAIETLLHYKQACALTKVALNVIAHRSTSEEIIELRKTFEDIDTSNDGTISFEELKDGLKTSNYSDETIEELFASIDVNHNGYIMYTEFVAAILETRGRIEEERIAEAFDHLDINHDGFLETRELKKILGKSCSDDMVDNIMKEYDLNHDGKISYKEFKEAFRTETLALVKKVGVSV